VREAVKGDSLSIRGNEGAGSGTIVTKLTKGLFLCFNVMYLHVLAYKGKSWVTSEQGKYFPMSVRDEGSLLFTAFAFLSCSSSTLSRLAFPDLN